MDPESVAIVQNIKSLADQLASMQAGGAEKAEPDTEQVGASPTDLPPEIAEKVLKYLKEMDKKPEDVEMSDDEDKDDVEKSAEGPTASDDAEARIDETTGEVNDKNINEVAKAIARMIAQKGSSKKVVAKSNGVAELYKVVKSLTEELKVQKEFNVNVLKGLGIADSILEAEKVEKAKAKPMLEDPQQIAKSLEMIRQMIGAGKVEEPVAQNGQGHVVAKSLAENDGSLLMSMFPKSKR